MISKQWWIAALALLLLAADAPKGSSGGDPVIPRCDVAAIQNQAVPAPDAGILTHLRIKEGMHVTKDMELARVDDRDAQAGLKVKMLDRDIADQKASNDVDIRHAQKQADVSKTMYDKLVQANRQNPNTVVEVEVLRAKFEWEKALLAVEQAKENAITNKLTALSKDAEVGAHEVAVERRILRAPYDGVVVNIFRHEGEWVAPGDNVVQIVRIDRLRVVGDLDGAAFTPTDIENRPVTVEIRLPGGQVKTVEGEVVYVSPVVTSGTKLPVWAEIDTPMEQGRPLVRDGMLAKMTIHVKQPPRGEVRPVSGRAPARN